MSVTTLVSHADGSDELVDLEPDLGRRLGPKALVWVDLASPSQSELARTADVLHLVMSEAKTGAVILTDGGAGTHTY